MSTDLKLSKAQISRTIQSGGFLGSLLSKLAGPLMKVAVSLTKKVLTSLGITEAASWIDAVIQKKIHGSGTTPLIILNEEMKNSNILLKGVIETIKIEKEQRGGFLGTLGGTLGPTLLGHSLSGKGIVRADSEN